jgi:hypothetical protein
MLVGFLRQEDGRQTKVARLLLGRHGFKLPLFAIEEKAWTWKWQKRI